MFFYWYILASSDRQRQFILWCDWLYIVECRPAICSAATARLSGTINPRSRTAIENSATVFNETSRRLSRKFSDYNPNHPLPWKNINYSSLVKINASAFFILDSLARDISTSTVPEVALVSTRVSSKSICKIKCGSSDLTKIPRGCCFFSFVYYFCQVISYRRH